MDKATMLIAAARNNAEWCDTFCRSRGIPGQFGPDYWASAQRTPQFYPDAVTLAPGVERSRLLASITPGSGASIKDSFADLDLAESGYEVLFAAQWFAGTRIVAAASGWSFVSDASSLTEWSSAWGDPTFFRATLLEDPHVAFLAQREHGAIAAGAIANQSADVIGISNVFAQTADLTTAWAEAVRAARQRFGPLPVVGYGTGEALLAAQAAALDPIGPLRVWSAPR